MPGKHVLVVDDEPSALGAMGAALERDFHVRLAPDTRSASDILEREQIDLVILDVCLEGESGLDFLNRLRERNDVPVLLISGYGTKEVVVGGLRARATDYLDKPFNAAQLLDRVRTLTAQGPRPSHISDRVRAFIQQQYMRDWTVEGLAKELRLSMRTMRQLFQQYFRQSAKDYLEEVRLMRARELLETTDASIQQIAAEVGFHDPHYFGRVFRQHFGQSPRDYRAARRTAQSEHDR